MVSHTRLSESITYRLAPENKFPESLEDWVLAAREKPLSPIHLRNMYELSLMGAVILPPVLSHYQSPKSLEDCTRHIVGKLLDQFGLAGDGFRRWEGMDG